MKKRRAYRATDVKDVVLSEILQRAPAGAVTAGIDNGKYEIFVVIRFKDGSFQRPWKVANPMEIGLLVGILQDLAAVRPLIVALESTGTYGDALRGKMAQAGLEVHRVGAKAAHDYAEIFDGVPSQHDGKDAAVIAELAAFGKSFPWPYQEPSAEDADVAYWVDWLDAQQDIQRLWTGRLEALLARHWPELTRLLGLTSVTLLRNAEALWRAWRGGGGSRIGRAACEVGPRHLEGDEDSGGRRFRGADGGLAAGTA